MKLFSDLIELRSRFGRTLVHAQNGIVFIQVQVVLVFSVTALNTQYYFIGILHLLFLLDLFCLVQQNLAELQLLLDLFQLFRVLFGRFLPFLAGLLLLFPQADLNVVVQSFVFFCLSDVIMARRVYIYVHEMKATFNQSNGGGRPIVLSTIDHTLLGGFARRTCGLLFKDPFGGHRLRRVIVVEAWMSRTL